MGYLSNSVQEVFFSWLSQKVSSAQLSDYYLVFSEIDVFCRSRNVIKASLFEVMDEKTINKVKNALESNKAFKFLHRSSYLKMSSALSFYKSFLHEKQGAFGALMSLYQSDVLSDKKSNCKQSENAKNGSDILMKAGQPSDTLAKDNDSGTVNNKSIEEASCVSTGSICQVSFWVDKSYAFTRPIKIEYFGEEYNVSNWTQAYVQAVCLLLDDYPSEIGRFIGKNISNGKRIDFCSKQKAAEMVAPKRVSDDFYVETNLSATDIVDKIKRLLEICLIDYENMVITYATTAETDAAPQNEVRNETIEKLVVEDEKTVRSAFVGWMMTAGLKPATIFSYLSALNQSGKFGLEHHLINSDFLQMDDPDAIHCAYEALMQNSEFSQWNQNQHNRFRAAIMKYHEYRSGVATSADSVSATAPPSSQLDAPILSAELMDRFAIVLCEFFENGYRPGNAIDINRFRLFYSEKYGRELVESDERITKMLGVVGSVRNGRIYAKVNSEQRDVLAEIRADVDAAFAAGASCVYLEALFDRYQDQLIDSLQIFNADDLKEAFLAGCGGGYYSRYSYLALYKRPPDTDNDVLSYMKASHVPVNYDTLKRDLWHIPFDKIKHILVTTRAMVNVGQETYFYAPNLPVSADELKTIIELIQGELLQNSFVSGTDLIALIEKHCPSVIINTEGFSAVGLRNALGYVLRDYFAFNGNIVSSLRKEMNVSQLFTGYCLKRDRVTLEELKGLALEANTRIYWESVQSVMVRVSIDEFINKRDMHFDVPAIDSVLEIFIAGEYASTKSINLFFQFPASQYPWNGYMLESYVYSYSKQFRLVHPCFQQTNFCGAIVRTGSSITEYYDMVVRVLCDTNEWHDKESALGILIGEGYQQRNIYKGIDAAIAEAKRYKATTRK